MLLLLINSKLSHADPQNTIIACDSGHHRRPNISDYWEPQLHWRNKLCAQKLCCHTVLYTPVTNYGVCRGSPDGQKLRTGKGPRVGGTFLPAWSILTVWKGVSGKQAGGAVFRKFCHNVRFLEIHTHTLTHKKHVWKHRLHRAASANAAQKRIEMICSRPQSIETPVHGTSPGR